MNTYRRTKAPNTGMIEHLEDDSILDLEPLTKFDGVGWTLPVFMFHDKLLYHTEVENLELACCARIIIFKDSKYIILLL